MSQRETPQWAPLQSHYMKRGRIAKDDPYGWKFDTHQQVFLKVGLKEIEGKPLVGKHCREAA